MKRFLKFALEVDTIMRPNRYHNRLHVADVVQLMFLQTEAGGGPLHLLCADPVIRLSAILAAAVHDLCHPGYSNGFLVKTKHPLVARYGTKATAERMHVAAFRHLLTKPSMDFLSPLSAAERERIFGYVEDMVLATDMSDHLWWLQGEVPTDEDQQLKFRLCLAMKVADMSHTMREFDEHVKFVSYLKEESYRQGDREKALGVPMSPGMDRTATVTQGRESQVAFMLTTVKPLLERWTFCSGACKLVAEMERSFSLNVHTWKVAPISGCRMADRHKTQKKHTVAVTKWQ
uniref:3 5-cyclic nucleotide phosphodiesterase n=2 Tax=Tetraselmis sp. GSL018 TaxID=582737 RepID=A0A061QKV2_9CHLO